jgi:glycine/D-amino acid oxidase-like deaminating enzyme
MGLNKPARRADAVVIGAGALGLSAGYHLAKLGRRVVIVDQFAPASQTSPRAAGLFKLIQSDQARTRLAQLSVRIVTNFERETGIPLEVAHSGSLMVARTREHADLVRAESERSAGWGVALQMIDERECRQLAPFLEPEGIQAACHTPGDVYIEEPAYLLEAYIRAGQIHGAEVIPHLRVTGIRVQKGEVVGIVTAEGEIETPIVVDAAGAWARRVAGLAGVSLPVVPVRHQLLITEPISGVEAGQPIVRLIDSAVYVRPARGGLMLGGFEADPLPLEVTREREAFSMDDVPLDPSVLTRLGATVERNVPALANAPVKEQRGGLFTMTPDGQLIVGPHPDLRGLWIATGCNGSGFSLSPGIGQVLAEWIVGGEPSIDMTPCAAARFADQKFDDEQLRAQGTWQYAHYYEPLAPTLPRGPHTALPTREIPRP